MSALCNKVFSVAPVKCVFLYGSNNSYCVVFGNAAFGKIKEHSLRVVPFQNKIIYESLGFVSTLRKKMFLGGRVNCFPLYGSNNSDSVVFGNATFGEFKDHSFRSISFQKRNLL